MGISERKREAISKQRSVSGGALSCTQKGGGRDFNLDTLTRAKTRFLTAHRVLPLCSSHGAEVSVPQGLLADTGTWSL